MRNFLLLIASNVTLESALPIVIVVSGLSGLMLAPIPELATVPATAQLLSAAAAARLISRVMFTFGRRAGFFLCAISMILGACFGATAILIQNFPILVISHIFLGISIVGINYFRYAAAETAAAKFKAIASSIMLASGVVAVPIGGYLYQVSAGLLAPVLFAGAYLVIALIGFLACIFIAFLRFPPVMAPAATMQSIRRNTVIWKVPDIRFALMSMGFGHACMLLVMTPASIAAVSFGFGDEELSQLIGFHLVAMFAPGFVTGVFIQKFGPKRVIGVGAALQLVGFMVGPFLEQHSSLYLPLIYSGIGWNFMFLGGTHIVNAVQNPRQRSDIQGHSETLLAVFSAIFVLSSAPIYENLGWNFVLGTAALLVILFTVLLLFNQWLSARTKWNLI